MEKSGDFRSCERTEKSRINSSSVTSLRSVSLSRTTMMHLRRESSKQLACLRFAEDSDVSAAEHGGCPAALDRDSGARRTTAAGPHIRNRHEASMPSLAIVSG